MLPTRTASGKAATAPQPANDSDHTFDHLFPATNPPPRATGSRRSNRNSTPTPTAGGQEGSGNVRDPSPAASNGQLKEKEKEEEEVQLIDEEQHEEQAQDEPKQKEASPAMFNNFDAFPDYEEDARQATRQIDTDIEEAQRSLKANGANPHQMLHTIESWLSTVMDEFVGKKETIRLRLQKKWLCKELRGQAPDLGHRQKLLYEAIQRLEAWKKSGLLTDVELLAALCHPKGSSIPQDALRDALGRFLESLQQVQSDITTIRNYRTRPSRGQRRDGDADSRSNINRLPQEPDADEEEDREGEVQNVSRIRESADEDQSDRNAEITIRSIGDEGSRPGKHSTTQIAVYLKQLQELNAKQTFTIVVLGLEKAGKSTFINAILGAEILPTDEGRCTMVHTDILPSTKNDLEITIIFRTKRDFERTLNSLPRMHGESTSQLEERKTRIRRACQEHVGRPAMQRVANSRDEERRAIDETRDYLVSPEKMYVVQRVVIGTRRLGATGVPWQISDEPGYDSTIEEHRTIALEAISNADAFIILTNGTKPDLTHTQIQFLAEIREKHYDAMSKAFGVITWLDTLDHVEKYERSLSKAKEQFLIYGFSEQNVFPVCSIAAFEDPPEKIRKIVANIGHKLDTYPGLADGFENCIASIKHCVSTDLPIRRVKEAVDMANKHILSHVAEALQYGRAIIPDYIDATKLSQVVEATNIESWGLLFEQDRFLPTLEAANEWKNKTIITQSRKLAQGVVEIYNSLLDEEFDSAEWEVTDLTKAMLADQAWVQVNHWTVEDTQRQKLVKQFSKIMDRVAFDLAERLYANYIEALVALLNTRVCSEEPYVFTTGLQVQQCQWEVRALLRRVAQPIVLATLRWPHVNERSRKGAANDLARVLPWEAAKIAFHPDSGRHLPNLSSLLLSFVPTALGAAGAPYAAQLGALADMFGQK